MECHVAATLAGFCNGLTSSQGDIAELGKESDRRWEEGAELESLSYIPMEFKPPGSEHNANELVRASEGLIRRIREIGIRELVRSGFGRRILEKICRRELVNAETLREYDQKIHEYRVKIRSMT